MEVKGNPYQTQHNSHQTKIEATQQMHMRDASHSPVKTTSRRSELSRFVEIKQSCDEKNAKGLNLMQCLIICIDGTLRSEPLIQENIQFTTSTSLASSERCTSQMKMKTKLIFH